MSSFHDALEMGQKNSSAEHVLRCLETKYFPEVPPITAIQVVNDPTFSSRYLPPAKIIQINSGIANFSRLLQILILHELVHHKLFVRDPAYASSPYGEPFKSEIKKLIEKGGYDDLL